MRSSVNVPKNGIMDLFIENDRKIWSKGLFYGRSFYSQSGD